VRLYGASRGGFNDPEKWVSVCFLTLQSALSHVPKAESVSHGHWQAVEKLRPRPLCGVAQIPKMLTYCVYAALFESRMPCHLILVFQHPAKGSIKNNVTFYASLLRLARSLAANYFE
jgi:hypothetical protein